MLEKMFGELMKEFLTKKSRIVLVILNKKF